MVLNDCINFLTIFIYIQHLSTDIDNKIYFTSNLNSISIKNLFFVLLYHFSQEKSIYVIQIIPRIVRQKQSRLEPL